jgi:hypothetical protein
MNAPIDQVWRRFGTIGKPAAILAVVIWLVYEGVGYFRGRRLAISE